MCCERNQRMSDDMCKKEVSDRNNTRKETDLRPWNRLSLYDTNEILPDSQDIYLNSSREDYMKSEQSSFIPVKREFIDAFDRIQITDTPEDFVYSENVVSQRYRGRDRDYSRSMNLDSDNWDEQQPVKSSRNGEFHLQRRHTDSDVPMLINLNEENPPVQDISEFTPKSFDELKEIDWQAYSKRLIKEESEKDQFKRDRSFLSEFDIFK
ncbi:11165_t:CDS:2 [Diversispora eburnea]|uniref:11165_t:CDS:1 n=1 Tax=Diversispora eburnea TaxID=1213867 RepID=A0A9N8Z6E4_9GLOM|nr:11165_t:CDS:2 [Diversispora eburnea]